MKKQAPKRAETKRPAGGHMMMPDMPPKKMPMKEMPPEGAMGMMGGMAAGAPMNPKKKAGKKKGC